MRVGLYFGSFNPIHTGHIHVAQEAQKQFALDEVWLVISPQNPFKDAHDLAPEMDRLAIALIACQDTPHIRPCDIEFSMPRPSFTISTIQRLLSEYPDNSFYLIIGEDNLQFFHQWKDVHAILRLVEVIVYPRSNEAVVLPIELLSHRDRFHRLSGRLIPISATTIREQLKMGLNPHAMLHPDVLHYIQQHHLYSY